MSDRKESTRLMVTVKPVNGAMPASYELPPGMEQEGLALLCNQWGAAWQAMGKYEFSITGVTRVEQTLPLDAAVETLDISGLTKQ